MIDPEQTSGSPRTEILHNIDLWSLYQYGNMTLLSTPVQAIRVGDWKLFTGQDASKWYEPESSPCAEGTGYCTPTYESTDDCSFSYSTRSTSSTSRPTRPRRRTSRTSTPTSCTSSRRSSRTTRRRWRRPPSASRTTTRRAGLHLEQRLHRPFFTAATSNARARAAPFSLCNAPKEQPVPLAGLARLLLHGHLFARARRCPSRLAPIWRGTRPGTGPRASRSTRRRGRDRTRARAASARARAHSVRELEGGSPCRPCGTTRHCTTGASSRPPSTATPTRATVAAVDHDGAVLVPSPAIAADARARR